MADYSALKATIDASINTNGQQAITGAILNDVLNEMVDVLGEGYTFLGVATISTNPTTPEGKAYYLAGAAGTYPNFGNIVVASDEVALLVWSGTAWSKVVSPAASKEEVGQLNQNVDDLTGATETLDITWTNGMIYYTGSIGQVSTNSGYKKSNDIQLKKGDTITFSGGSDSTIRVLAIAEHLDDDYIYVKEYATREAEDVSFVAPKDMAVVISTQKSLASGDVVLNKNGEVNTLNEDTEVLRDDITDIDDEVFGVLYGQNIVEGLLNTNNGILVISQGSYSNCIKVEGGWTYRIETAANLCIFAFLTEKAISGLAVSYASGTAPTALSPHSSAEGTIPSDAKYLLISMAYQGASREPSKVVLNGKDYTTAIRDLLQKDVNAIYEGLRREDIEVTENAGYYLQPLFLGRTAAKISSSQTNYIVTDPIKLSAGDRLFVKCKPVTSTSVLTCPVAALSDSEGNLGGVVLKGEQGLLSYLAKEDCYIVLCYNNYYEKEVWKVSTSSRESVTEYDLRTERDTTYYDFNSKEFKAGNNIWFSKTINAENADYINFVANTAVATSNVAMFAFLDSDDAYIGHLVPYNSESAIRTINSRVYLPARTAKVVISLHSAAINVSYFYFNTRKNIGYVEKNEFNTMREMAESTAKGLISVGGMQFRSKVSSPEPRYRTSAGVQNGNLRYFAANTSFKQYESLADSRFIEDGILDGNIGEEIDFTPEAGYMRKIVGKGEDDKFYICFYPTNHWADASSNWARTILEVTTDFVSFESIFRGFNDSVDDGITIANIAINDIKIVKECADGSLIVGCKYTDVSLPATDELGNTNYNVFLGLIRISADRQSATICTGTDIDGNASRVIGSHGLADGGTTYVTANMYDWSLQVYGQKVLMTEYGSRDSLHDDWGRVWYSEDCGVTWKEVFQTRNHISEGVSDGISQPSHTHGIMIDPYSDTIWVIVGETNRNLFYTDKGMQAGDADWTCLPIREQLILPQLAYMQVVNGYPFKDRIVFGSDNSGIGALYAINRLADGGFSEIEIAHEILPFNFNGTSYCAAAQSRRDVNSPALLCVTRENQASTEAQNEVFMRQHLGRVIATWDGIKFFEIWHDNSYGQHPAKVGGVMTTKNYAYCTRDMQAWLTKSGDLVVKYAGRDYFYYGGADYSSLAYGDFCSRCYIIRNAERYLVVK